MFLGAHGGLSIKTVKEVDKEPRKGGKELKEGDQELKEGDEGTREAEGKASKEPGDNSKELGNEVKEPGKVFDDFKVPGKELKERKKESKEGKGGEQTPVRTKKPVITLTPKATPRSSLKRKQKEIQEMEDNSKKNKKTRNLLR